MCLQTTRDVDIWSLIEPGVGPGGARWSAVTDRSSSILIAQLDAPAPPVRRPYAGSSHPSTRPCASRAPPVRRIQPPQHPPDRIQRKIYTPTHPSSSPARLDTEEKIAMSCERKELCSIRQTSLQTSLQGHSNISLGAD